MITNSYNYVSLLWFLEVKFQVLREDSLVFYQAEYYCSISKNYRFLSLPSSYSFNQRRLWQWILRSGKICTLFPHYPIHAMSADLQIHIFLSLYDITLSQTVFRLLLLLLYHPLRLATLPSHTVICVLSPFSQSISKNLTRSGVMPCEDLSSACRILSPSSRESLDVLISLIIFKA